MPLINNISMHVTVGETYQIHIPIDKSLGSGYHYRTAPIIIDGETITLKKGFYVENEVVGQIYLNYSDKLAVDYKHLLPGENNVWFYANTGEIVKFYVTHMQVHDHASIVTGGPAYGTYYSPPQI